ncbi:unnamed protein product [Paramecium primaurelia]|uniref:Uncharacterized protein n=1 Tax=Paramecium primaurelia TaxID=5886 RepID=A0A8S1PAT4_PARPR|nr:unnamed protein product [Paramecium primaurelia]
MLLKKIVQQFCSQFEKNIQKTRRTPQVINQVKIEESTTEEKESDYSLRRMPFYRFPIGLQKNFYYLIGPLIFYDFTQMQSPYFSHQLTNAFCQLNDIYIFGFAGIVGAIAGCHFVSGKPFKYLGLYSSSQLICLLGNSVLMYYLSPYLFGFYFVGILSHLIWYNNNKGLIGVPKSFNNLYLKSMVFSSLFIFAAIGGIVLLNQEIKHIEIKIEELQKLSDSLKEGV